MAEFIRRNIPKDFLIEVQKGNVEGHRGIFRSGKVQGVGTNVNSISLGITGIVPKKTTASQFHMSSTSTDDTNGGIGAEALSLSGLDSDFNEISETVVLNGTGVVSTVNNYIGFPLALAVVNPTGGQYPLFTLRKAQGEITVFDDVGGTTEVVKIGSGGGESFNFSLHAAYIVPLGHTLFMHQFTMGVNQGKSAVVEVRGQLEGTVVFSLIVFDLFENTVTFSLPLPSNLPEKSLLEMTAFSSAAGVDVFCGFEAILIENRFVGQFFSVF